MVDNYFKGQLGVVGENVLRMEDGMTINAKKEIIKSSLIYLQTENMKFKIFEIKLMS